MRVCVWDGVPFILNLAYYGHLKFCRSARFEQEGFTRLRYAALRSELMRNEGLLLLRNSLFFCRSSSNRFLLTEKKIKINKKKEWHLIPEGTFLSPTCQKQTCLSFSRALERRKTHRIGNSMQCFPIVTVLPFYHFFSFFSLLKGKETWLGFSRLLRKAALTIANHLHWYLLASKVQ